MKLVLRGIFYYYFVNLCFLCIDICVEIYGFYVLEGMGWGFLVLGYGFIG